VLSPFFVLGSAFRRLWEFFFIFEAKQPSNPPTMGILKRCPWESFAHALSMQQRRSDPYVRMYGFKLEGGGG